MVWKSGQSYSTDLRSRVLAVIDGGSPAKIVARQFQVSVSYIYKALHYGVNDSGIIDFDHGGATDPTCGMSVDKRRALEEDTTVQQPYFRIGMMENPGARDQARDPGSEREQP